MVTIGRRTGATTIWRSERCDGIVVAKTPTSPGEIPERIADDFLPALVSRCPSRAAVVNGWPAR
jgi:hypothetical protein